MTTIYGQMVSVYQYPKPVLLILGGSTFGAIVIGYLYGRNHRVWCRYLCPVNGVFGVLAKLAPLHFGVDEEAWALSRRSHDAGVRVSPWYVALKQAVAGWLVDHGVLCPLASQPPWWILTDYPALNDQMTLLDGGVLLAYIGATALVIGAAVSLCVWLAAGGLGPSPAARFHHLAQALIPVAGCGVFLGLSDHRHHAASRGLRTRIRRPFAGSGARRRGDLDHLPWLESRGSYGSACFAPLRCHSVDRFRSFDRCRQLGHAFLGLAIILQQFQLAYGAYAVLPRWDFSRNSVEDIGERGPCTKTNAGGTAVARHPASASSTR
jgi:4Fe-4S binding domain